MQEEGGRVIYRLRVLVPLELLSGESVISLLSESQFTIIVAFSLFIRLLSLPLVCGAIVSREVLALTTQNGVDSLAHTPLVEFEL